MYNKLGTFDTYDAPTEKINEAFSFLFEKYKAIGGYVWKKINVYGIDITYPSFEIDKPSKFEDLDEEDESDENITLLNEYDDWIDKAGEIETKYSNKYFN
jgi:hypothetical protein